MKRSILILAALSSLGIATSVSAQEPAATIGTSQVGATLGYGVYVGEGDSDAYGLGLGIHGGHTLDMSVYVGGFFNYFLGGTTSAGGVEVSANVMQIAGDVGYDLGVGELVIRPSLGLGVEIFSAKITGAGAGIDGDNSETYLLLAPGARLVVPMDGFYVGGELRYSWLPTEDGGDALLIAANVGAEF